MWHIFMKHTYKDTHREPCIVLLRWGISMMKQNLKQMMMIITMFRYGADNDEYDHDDNFNDDKYRR